MHLSEIQSIGRPVDDRGRDIIVKIGFTIDELEELNLIDMKVLMTSPPQANYFGTIRSAVNAAIKDRFTPTKNY